MDQTLILPPVATSPFSACDPLAEWLEATLLPALAFESKDLDLVVECLRQLSIRALANAQLPTPGGISITLLATPSRRAVPVSLNLEEGTSLLDALMALANGAGLVVVLGAVGVLLCPPEMAEVFQRQMDAESVPPLTEEGCCLNRAQRLRLVALYPVLAISNSPITAEWLAAFGASDGSAQAAYTLAHNIVSQHPDDGCSPLTQVPLHLPVVPDHFIPGLPWWG